MLLLLLPQLAPVEAESVDVVEGVLVITAHTRDGPVACPGCGMVADWEHSRYVRHVADEAVGGRPARWRASMGGRRGDGGEMQVAPLSR